MKISKILQVVLYVSFVTMGYSQTYEKVSFIGDNEKLYEGLVNDCNQMLLNVANNNMDTAFSVWTDMFSKLESYAEEQGVDIKGAKIWVNLFWEPDGSIKQISYYPKPQSKNMDFEQLSLIMDSFAKEYKLPLVSDTCFTHYGSASFPVFTKVSARNGN